VPPRDLALLEVWQHERAIACEREARVVRDLPRVTVGIDENAGVAAVERRLRPARDRRTETLSRRDELVDFVVRADVVRERDAVEATSAALLKTTVGRELLATPQDDRDTARLEEDRLLHFLAFPAETFIEDARAFEVVDAERDEAYALVHCPSI